MTAADTDYADPCAVLPRVTINFAAEEAPVLRYLGIQSARYRPALDALLDDLLAQVDAVTG